ncbi:FKBP-type peptidyl-prolyl cis-trans isomerase [Candidatus Kaiserbacteria bacterium]|nr:FKBP-type peptidyl-prolyl cis-trans isomerase [Candidatus Kaiserbacteria bacterium]
MNTKTILIIVVVIPLLAAGGYYLYQNYSGTPQTGQTPTDQVQAQEIKVGGGATAAPGSIISVLYTGTLPDGTVFDSSEAHGNQPLVFQLGAPGIIAGFQIGVNGMREGGERVMQVPPSLGYGGEDITDPATGAVIIPANSTLVFNVKLVKVEAAPSGDTTTPQSE